MKNGIASLKCMSVNPVDPWVSLGSPVYTTHKTATHYTLYNCNIVKIVH